MIVVMLPMPKKPVITSQRSTTVQKGYWHGRAAILKLAKAAGVSESRAEKWLAKQAIWQIYLPAHCYLRRPKFDVAHPNEVHQSDLLFLPHDRVGSNTYKYALTVVDVASR